MRIGNNSLHATWFDSIRVKLKWPQKGNEKKRLGRERGVLGRSYFVLSFRKRTRSTFYHIFFFLVSFRFVLYSSGLSVFTSNLCLPFFAGCVSFLFRLTVHAEVLFLCWPHTAKCINHWTSSFCFDPVRLFPFLPSTQRAREREKKREKRREKKKKKSFRRHRFTSFWTGVQMKKTTGVQSGLIQMSAVKSPR